MGGSESGKAVYCTWGSLHLGVARKRLPFQDICFIFARACTLLQTDKHKGERGAVQRSLRILARTEIPRVVVHFCTINHPFV